MNDLAAAEGAGFGVGVNGAAEGVETVVEFAPDGGVKTEDALAGGDSAPPGGAEKKVETGSLPGDGGAAGSAAAA
ncbi:MAG: hypothetical protein EBS05_03440 [Proteobacteria bacterium]|nr:hypothetical protein [Pseudomonadota bacterium]